ncbi:MAG: TrmB family transcriptional regulator [Propionibacteriaceae bacterium]
MATTPHRPAANDLAAIGLSSVGEGVYRTLLAQSTITPAELAEELRVDVAAVETQLATLRAAGLASRLSGRPRRYTAVEPDAAIEALVRDRIAELEKVRSTSLALSATFHAVQRSAVGSGAIEVLSGPSELGRWFVRIQHQVRHEMLAFDRPPYALAATNPVEPVSLRQGVEWRVVYAPESLELDGALDEINELAELGEQARVHAGLPLKMVIADRRLALLPLSLDLEQTEVALIHESTLLDALIQLFEHYWRVALPLGVADTPGAELGAVDTPLLTLLTSGLTDSAIARQMGWSARTMNRRMRELFDELGAQNRFQAGVQAARRGLA